MKLSKVRDVKDPQRGTKGSAGIDFFIPNDTSQELLNVIPNDSVLIPSGIKCNVPENFALVAFNKSGVATKLGLDVGAAVVDSDYQGELHIHLFNTKNYSVQLERGQKIVQFLLVPVDHRDIEIVNEEVLFEEVTERGEGGFGSTGTK